MANFGDTGVGDELFVAVVFGFEVGILLKEVF